MKSLRVLTLLSLLYLATLNVVQAEENISRVDGPAQSTLAPLSFTFAAFSEINRDSFKFTLDSDLRDNPPGIELTPWYAALGNDTVDGVEKGKVFYKDPIQIKAKTGHTIVSFSTSFTFVIKSENYSDTGDGLAFVLVADPYFEGDGAGQFSIFRAGTAPSPTVAVEFDTFMNDDLMDMDANHVGIDIDSAFSLMTASASTVNISLQDGRPVTAWIDYDADQRNIEVRINDDTTKPTEPLIKGPLDLSLILARKMWVGFSASTHIVAHQRHEITYWTFECESLHQGGSSLLERLKRFWRTSPSYAVVAVGAALVVLLIVGVLSCCCCCPCCRKFCPCFSKRCTCCPRWCHLGTKKDGRPEQTKTTGRGKKRPRLSKSSCCPGLPRCTCPRSFSTCKCSCKNCCRMSRCSKCYKATIPPEGTGVPEEGSRKKKPCPLAFLELIQEDVSQEKKIDLTLPESIQACLPVENPFSTERVVQPGCISSLLFGAETDDDEHEAKAPPPARSPSLATVMMMSNTVFDEPPEQICENPDHCPERDRTSSAADCLVGDNCLLQSNAKQQPTPAAPQREPRGKKVKSTQMKPMARASYDMTPEEQIAMGWGYFSP